MPNLFKTNGIVLSSKILPSNDVVYTVLTIDKGKIRVFGKGIKKISSKRKPHLQTGNLITMVLRKSQETYYLQETTLISAFSQIKQSSTKLNWLYSFIFMVDRLIPEMEVDEPIYSVVQKFLVDLSKENREPELFTKSANSLLRLLGFSSHELPLSEIKEQFSELTGQKLPLNTI